MGPILRIVVCVLLLATTACGANHNAVFRYKVISTDAKSGPTSLVTIDAKQRAIITQGGKVCTEPPPDVFSVLAQSVGANASLSKSADPTSLGVAGAFSYSGSEQGATISRTQAFNLLALQTYYNCLTSLNSPSADIEVPIDRIRLERLMISTLAIEQLTGALRPPTVVIAASGSASTGSAEAMAALGTAMKASQTAAGEVTTDQKTLDDLNGAGPKCSDIDTKVAAGTALSADEKTKQPPCKTATDALAAAKAAKDTSDKHYAALLALSGNGVPTLATTATSDPKVIESTKPNPAAVQQVASAVVDIVKQITGQDETQLFCMRAIDSPADQYGVALRQQCSKFLLAQVKLEVQHAFGQMTLEEQRQFQQENEDERSEIAAQTLTQFQAFWQKVLNPGSQAPDPARLAALIDPILSAGTTATTSNDLNSLKASSTLAAAQPIFGQLPNRIRILLAK